MRLVLMWTLAPCSCDWVAATHPASVRVPGPTREWQGAGPMLCSPCLSRRGSRARPLGSGRGGSCWQWCSPPPSLVEGLPGVGFGCPGLACALGLVSQVADWLWGRAGPQAVPVRVSPWLAHRDGCQQGHQPAWLPAGRDTAPPFLPPAPCMLLVTRCVLEGAGPCHPLWGVT